jgi:hypothetical protein
MAVQKAELPQIQNVEANPLPSEAQHYFNRLKGIEGFARQLMLAVGPYGSYLVPEYRCGPYKVRCITPGSPTDIELIHEGENGKISHQLYFHSDNGEERLRYEMVHLAETAKLWTTVEARNYEDQGEARPEVESVTHSFEFTSVKGQDGANKLVDATYARSGTMSEEKIVELMETGKCKEMTSAKPLGENHLTVLRNGMAHMETITERLDQEKSYQDIQSYFSGLIDLRGNALDLLAGTGKRQISKESDDEIIKLALGTPGETEVVLQHFDRSNPDNNIRYEIEYIQEAKAFEVSIYHRGDTSRLWRTAGIILPDGTQLTPAVCDTSSHTYRFGFSFEHTDDGVDVADSAWCIGASSNDPQVQPHLTDYLSKPEPLGAKYYYVLANAAIHIQSLLKERLQQT